MILNTSSNINDSMILQFFIKVALTKAKTKISVYRKARDKDSISSQSTWERPERSVPLWRWETFKDKNAGIGVDDSTVHQEQLDLSSGKGSRLT